MTQASISATLKQFSQSVVAPVDGASLALFRMLFGLVALSAVGLAFLTIQPELIAPDFHFQYQLFHWLAPLPAPAMYALLAMLGLAAVLMSLGLLYRPATWVFLLGYGYLYFLDQALYTNSGWLLLLAAFLMCWLPANRTWALDARLFPRIASAAIPRWAPWSVAALIAVPLLYTGLWRLNPDWLDGYPFRLWLPDAWARHALRASLPRWLASPEFAQGFSIAAVVIHLALVPMLLWRRTRGAAVVLYVLYYAALSFLFQRVIVSTVTLAGFVVFFAPDWPRRVLAALRRQGPVVPAAVAAAQVHVPPGRATAAVLAVFFAFHALFPARGLLYPGVSAWTGDGYRFAWRDMLDDKSCDAQYTVKDPETDRTWNVAPSREVASFQARELSVRPDMLPHFARRVQANSLRKRGVESPQVFARIKCSLNSRPPALLLDPALDLTQVEATLGPTPWVTPGNRAVPRGWGRLKSR